MALTAGVGQAQALDGTEAGIQATQAALNQIGRSQVALGFVICAHEFNIQQVLHGVNSLLGEVPLLGFSTSAGFSAAGPRQRSVVVGLLAGNEIEARASWWPGFAEEAVIGSDISSTAQKLVQELQPHADQGALLLIGDGLGSSVGRVAQQLLVSLKAFPKSNQPLPSLETAGCLAAGDLRRARTYQIGGQQSGSGGLAAAYLGGRIAVGVGVNHGWSATGAYFKVTRAKGLWLRTLDDRPAAETYARLFGHRPREWGVAPLNELVRLYPLGIEETTTSQASVENQGLRHLVRSPLRVENDGSLRMNTKITEGSTGYLLVGSASNCLEAARQAARQALNALRAAPGSPKPVFALVLVDAAWKMLLQAQPGAEVEAVCSVLGSEVPVMGGYTFGQIARTGPEGSAELLNQYIEVIVFGEPAE